MRQPHPDNIPVENRYIPVPVEWSTDIPRYMRRELNRQSVKVVVDLIWYKFRDKIVQTLWLINRDKKKVIFRFGDIELTTKYVTEEELTKWLNIQLLKFVGITTDLWYIFYHLYRRNVKSKIYWKGFSPQSEYCGNIPEI